ncbi:hypothetical protein M7I_4351 [Glarea lozoyensis 74030]|uniref:Uncharacterized protein n=1 Tax=Glarea lozoyensis (strain ATCC 74030 / MF5533) TaxID=1104152 RepID=H0ENY6_GLAL7|nr:hypothetical protein M7I_4351 [Glarea lozoyensis 74030]
MASTPSSATQKRLNHLINSSILSLFDEPIKAIEREIQPPPKLFIGNKQLSFVADAREAEVKERKKAAEEERARELNDGTTACENDETVQKAQVEEEKLGPQEISDTLGRLGPTIERVTETLRASIGPEVHILAQMKMGDSDFVMRQIFNAIFESAIKIELVVYGEPCLPDLSDSDEDFIPDSEEDDEKGI